MVTDRHGFVESRQAVKSRRATLLEPGSTEVL